jgi:hypothetical protein
MRSIYGDEFRTLMEVWDRQQVVEAIDHLKDRVKALVNANGFILFLKRKGADDVFGADENGRLAFAQMKEPGEDVPDGWADEANFTCTNLSRAVRGEPTQTVFSGKDIPDLSVVEDMDDVIDALLGSGGPKVVSVKAVKNKPEGKLLNDKKK